MGWDRATTQLLQPEVREHLEAVRDAAWRALNAIEALERDEREGIEATRFFVDLAGESIAQGCRRVVYAGDRLRTLLATTWLGFEQDEVANYVRTEVEV